MMQRKSQWIHCSRIWFDPGVGSLSPYALITAKMHVALLLVSWQLFENGNNASCPDMEVIPI